MTLMTPQILIIEDDSIYALQIESLLDKLGYTAVSIISNYEQAISYLETHHVDIIIVDIVLVGEETGIDIAERIKERLIPILFITSYDSEDFYKRANTIPLSGYLVKPFHAHSLDSHIRTLLTLAENSHFLRLDTHTGGIIKVSDIIYLEVDNTYTYIHTTTRKAVYKKSLTQLMQLLPMHLFLQIHRSILVQKRHIKAIDLEKNLVVLENKIELPISRRLGYEIKKNLKSI